MRYEQRSINQLLTNDVLKYQAAPVAMTTTATVTSAAMLGGLITANQGAAGAATYTLPTGTVFGAAVDVHFGPSGMPADYSIEFTVVNISTNVAEIVTVAGAAGMTAVGNMVIAPNVAAPATPPVATFRVRRTGAAAFSFYRVG